MSRAAFRMEDPSGRIIYPNSIVEHAKGRYFLARTPQAKQLGVQGEPAGFSGAWDATGDTLFCPLTPENAALLRQKLPWLNPTPLGMQTSAGFGDRLGLATPGHIAARFTEGRVHLKTAGTIYLEALRTVAWMEPFHG
jgi:hypothetical protein